MNTLIDTINIYNLYLTLDQKPTSYNGANTTKLRVFLEMDAIFKFMP